MADKIPSVPALQGNTPSTGSSIMKSLSRVISTSTIALGSSLNSSFSSTQSMPLPLQPSLHSHFHSVASPTFRFLTHSAFTSQISAPMWPQSAIMLSQYRWFFPFWQTCPFILLFSHWYPPSAHQAQLRSLWSQWQGWPLSVFVFGVAALRGSLLAAATFKLGHVPPTWTVRRARFCVQGKLTVHANRWPFSFALLSFSSLLSAFLLLLGGRRFLDESDDDDHREERGPPHRGHCVCGLVRGEE